MSAGSLTDEQRNGGDKDWPNEGAEVRSPEGCVAPQSKSADGSAPLSRLALRLLISAHPFPIFVLGCPFKAEPLKELTSQNGASSDKCKACRPTKSHGTTSTTSRSRLNSL